MKIIYYSPHPNLGLNDLSGYGTHMREVVNGFRNLGHEVIPLIIGGEGSNQREGEIHFKQSRIKSFFRKIMPRYLWESLKDYKLFKFDKHAETELLKLVLKEKPDLIYERGYFLMSSGARVSKKTGVKLFIEYNAPYLEERAYFGGNSAFYGKAKKSEKLNCETAGRIIVVTSALKEFFAKKYNLERAKIIVTPNAINPDRFVLDDQKVSISFEKNDLVLGFVGSIFPYHKVDRLIRCVHQLHLSDKNVKALIVGGGEILNELQEIANKLGVQDKVIFTGNVKPELVPHYINLMDIAVVPNAKWYMSPVKLFEYGIMGKSVVAPDSPSVSDVLEDGRNSVLFKNEVDFYLKIKELAEDNALRQKISVNLKQDILDNHTWSKMAEKILN